MSDRWGPWKRAQSTIAQGALTNSKRPGVFIKGVFPTHLERGQGVHVWDTDGKRYIDFICGLGSNLLGHGHTEIENAVLRGFRKGPTLSLGTPLELDLAEKLQASFPCIERIKVLKTGTEGCAAAVRIARAATGRKTVLSQGYHGWSDEFVSLTPPAHGVPRVFEHTSTFDSSDQITEDVAAVIVEPIMTDASEHRVRWLHEIRDRCTSVGAVLVFDEVITGFRFPRLSVSNYHRINPDLIVLGKAMGGGMPIAVVGGSEKVMNCEAEYFVSSTFAGELCSISASLKVLELLQSKYYLDELWGHGAKFFRNFNELWPEKIRIQGYPTRGVFQGDKEAIDLFRQEACKAGVLFSTSVFFSFPHIQVVDQVLSTCQDIMTRMKTGSVRLEGEPSQTPFAQKVRNS